MKASDDLESWRLFLALADGEGLHRAALRRGIDKGDCSRRIRRLETELGTELLDHSVRPVVLTAEAERMVPAVRELVRAHDAVQALMESIGSAPVSWRFGVPANLGREMFHELIKTWRESHPETGFAMTVDADHEDVLEDRVDLAYLPYTPEHPDLIVWPLGEMRNCMFATKEYLRFHGTPEKPEDLARHSVIIRSGKNYPVTDSLTDGERTVPFVHAGIAVSGDVVSGFEALMAGDGIAVDLSYALLKEHADMDQLSPVLPGWHRQEWKSALVTSTRNQGNVRLLQFCRWFVNRERRNIRERRRIVDDFIAAHGGKRAGE